MGKTSYGTRGESGEREPKGAAYEDTRGEKRVGVPKEDSERGKEGYTREKEPKGAKASDSGGEKKARIAGGVGMGKADDLHGRGGAGSAEKGEFNAGRSESTVYRHERHKHGFTHKG